jgi:hypothetical protein
VDTAKRRVSQAGSHLKKTGGLVDKLLCAPDQALYGGVVDSFLRPKKEGVSSFLLFFSYT